MGPAHAFDERLTQEVRPDRLQKGVEGHQVTCGLDCKDGGGPARQSSAEPGDAILSQSELEGQVTLPAQSAQFRQLGRRALARESRQPSPNGAEGRSRTIHTARRIFRGRGPLAVEQALRLWSSVAAPV